MKNGTIVRGVLGACAMVAIAMLATAPVSTKGKPAFSYSIVFGGDRKVCVGEEGTVTVAWTTSRDVTRSQWLGEAEVAIEGASSGFDSRTFSSTVPGTFPITFSLRHHQQTDRVASGGTSVTVESCEDDDCPAAPAVANAYLNEIQFDGGRGNINSAVAAAMSAGQFGDAKCDPSYAEAVRAFVQGLLAS